MPIVNRLRKVAIIAALLLSTHAFAIFYWDNVEQHFDLRANGSVHVTDTRTLVGINEDFGEAFICIQHPSTMRIVMDRENSGAISPGPKASAFSQSCAGGTELVVKNDSRVTERRVTFAYEIQNAMSYYSDVVEWYWQVMEQDRPAIRGYELTVTFPEPLTEPYDAYVHRYQLLENLLKVRLSSDGKQLVVTYGPDSMPAGEGLDIRVFMPPTGFSRTGSNPGLEQLLRDEASFALLNVQGSPNISASVPATTRVGKATSVSGQASSPRGTPLQDVNIKVGNAATEACEVGAGGAFTCPLTVSQRGLNHFIISAIDVDGYRGTAEFRTQGQNWLDSLRSSTTLAIVYSAFIFLALLAYIVREYFRVGREPKTMAMKYQFEPPSDLPGGLALAIQHQRPDEKNMRDSLYATLLDLARRGHVTIEQEGRSKTSISLHHNENDPLREYEAELYRFLQPAANAEGVVTSRALTAHVKKRGQTFFPSWVKSLGLALANERGGPVLTAESTKASNTVLAFAGLGLVLLIAAGFFFTGDPIGVLVVTGILTAGLVVVARVAIPAFRPEIAQERAEWLAFKRTLDDYTIMKDAPADFFKLWDQYFIYAAAFGVAAKFLKNIARAAPLQGMDEKQMMANAMWLTRGGTDMSSISNLSSFADTATSISRSLSAATASASSGGSVGGGGGASGGGGSSGGR